MRKLGNFCSTRYYNKTAVLKSFNVEIFWSHHKLSMSHGFKNQHVKMPPSKCFNQCQALFIKVSFQYNLLQNIILRKSYFLKNLVFGNIQHRRQLDHFLFRPFHPFQEALTVLQSEGSEMVISQGCTDTLHLEHRFSKLKISRQPVR